MALAVNYFIIIPSQGQRRVESNVRHGFTAPVDTLKDNTVY